MEVFKGVIRFFMTGDVTRVARGGIGLKSTAHQNKTLLSHFQINLPEIVSTVLVFQGV